MKYLVHRYQHSYEFETDNKMNIFLHGWYLGIAMHKSKYGGEYVFDVVDKNYHEELHIYTEDERVSLFVSDEIAARLMQELKNV
jgi:hypothetical protein